MSLFDTYIIVDWSASNVPKRGKDSIWVCRLGPDGESVANPPTRHAARELLTAMLADAMQKGERVVAGFDFPFGYPAGFATRLGLSGTPWRAIWNEIARLVDDREDNRNNRFDVGADLNRRVSASAFPFWGCPANFASHFLGSRHHRGHTSDEPLKERRLIDEWMVGAQPCWKLAYTGSVGSQVLTGIPVVRALRDDERWAHCARVWPFETGLGLPEDAPHRLRRSAGRHGGSLAQNSDHPTTKRRCGRSPELSPRATGPASCGPGSRRRIDPANVRQVITEEAWTLGVTAPRVRSAKRRMSSPRGGRGIDTAPEAPPP